MYKSRKKHRLIGYDYSQEGYYFVTICTHNRNMLFGEMQKDCRGTIFCARNEYGNIAKKYWETIPDYYPYVTIDEYIIMPNHIHGIICINNGNVKNYNRTQDVGSLQNKFGKIIPGSLGSIIRGEVPPPRRGKLSLSR